MKENEYEQLDALLRILFREGDLAWYYVYTKTNIPKAEADWLYNILKADGYVRTKHKGSDFSITDSHVVGLTDLGLSWFSKTNYVTEYVLRPSREFVGQNINISNSKVSGLNAQIGNSRQKSNSKDDKSFWNNGWTISIGAGVILLLIGFLVKYFFGVS